MPSKAEILSRDPTNLKLMWKKGGKLIKRGQQGMKVVHTAPYNVEIYLEKDPISHPELQTYIPELDPEERMDQTIQELTPKIDPFTSKLVRSNTYLPTLEQRQAGTGTKHHTSWVDYVVGLTPLAVPAIVSSPYWAPVAATTLTNPTFWTSIATKTIPDFIKDGVLYAAADVTSEGITGKGIGPHINNAIGLPEEEHPVGEAIGFTGTSFLRKPVEKVVTTAYKGLRGTILPEYALSLAMDKSVDASTRVLSQQEIEEKAKILTLLLLNLLKTVGDNTVLIYTDEEASEVKRLLSVLNLHPEYGADGSFKFVGQINRKTPFDEALANLYKYRIKNNFTPTQENISLPNYIINTPNGLNFVNATHNVDKYITSLTDLPIFATVQKNYRPGVVGSRKATDIGRVHSLIYRVENPMDTKTTIIHENIGHGMNPLAPYYLSDIFGNKTMYNVYEDLANNIWNPTAAKVQFRELPLPPVEIQAEVANINQFILKKVAKVYNLSDEQILELSKNNPSLLDLMFKNEVDKLSNLELEAMLNALGSRYGRQLIRFLPGPHGLAAQDLFFNLMSRPETPSNELFLYDSLKQLRELNSLYTQELANNYLKNFKNILKYGFSAAGIGAVTADL